MDELDKARLMSRVKSLGWRMLWTVLAAVISWLVDPQFVQTLAGWAPKWAWALPLLVTMMGELSKWVHDQRNKYEAPPL